jgi:hypothetical protein
VNILMIKKALKRFLAATLVISLGATVCAAPSEWAVESVSKAEELGLGNAPGSKQYNKNLTREELAFVSFNLYRILSADNPHITDDDRTSVANAFTDSFETGKFFTDEIIGAIKYGLMAGITSNIFSPDDYVTRQQTAATLFRTAEKIGALDFASPADLTVFDDYSKIAPYAEEALSYMVSLGVISGRSGNIIDPLSSCTYEEVLSMAYRLYDYAAASVPEALEVFSILHGYETISEQSMERMMHHYIEIKSYLSNEEAMADMKAVTVNVWILGQNGSKTSSTRELLVHKGVADDVVSIFDEIFTGDERFPINAVMGYNWRGVGSRSAHNNGLAIDINPAQNYFIRECGEILAGSHWSPGDDPFSIKPDGDVVRAFSNHGWFWGGYGWTGTGYDYMHFSYTGT